MYISEITRAHAPRLVAGGVVLWTLKSVLFTKAALVTMGSVGGVALAAFAAYKLTRPTLEGSIKRLRGMEAGYLLAGKDEKDPIQEKFQTNLSSSNYLSVKSNLESDLSFGRIRDQATARQRIEELRKATNALFEGIEEQHLDQVIDFLFEKKPHDADAMLDVIASRYPNFSLSGFDQIRRAIVKDASTRKEHYELNNDSLLRMLKKCGLREDAPRLAACYDLAYRMKHPYIYARIAVPVQPTEYTINFVWFNREPQDRVTNVAQNIFGDGLDLAENAKCLTKKGPLWLWWLVDQIEACIKGKKLYSYQAVKTSRMGCIVEWVKKNPGVQFNLLYDSARVTEQARQNTFKMMRVISAANGVDLRLRDARYIPTIQQDFLHPAAPIHLGADVGKAGLAQHLISPDHEWGLQLKYCVVSDFDVEPMSREQLFDARTMNYLTVNGYVFNKFAAMNFENSFFIFNRANEKLRQVHQETVLDPLFDELQKLRQIPAGKSSTALKGGALFSNYVHFRREMGEHYLDNAVTDPRKVAKCPETQFNALGRADDNPSAPANEEFRFVGDVAYTYKGRAFQHFGAREGVLPSLRSWRAEPLAAV